MKIVHSVTRMAKLADRWHRQGMRIAFVPTMGALHQGHLSLVRAARRSADRVVVSIFVNPLQFGPKEDFSLYPRTLRADRRLLSREKADVLFCPSAEKMFPEGFATKVSVAGLSDTLCGKFRPGHFDGVASVVAKLFCIVRPGSAFFGQKDYQQCKSVEQMTADLDLRVKIRMLPTVREKNGLAMSSRNRYLSASQRVLAARIFRILSWTRQAARRGERDVRLLTSMARRRCSQEGISDIDYVQVVDGTTLQPMQKVRSRSVLAIAVRIGSTRLIDNVILR